MQKKEIMGILDSDPETVGV